MQRKSKKSSLQDGTPERDAVQLGGRGRLVDRAEFDKGKLLFIVQVDGQHWVARLEIRARGLRAESGNMG